MDADLQKTFHHGCRQNMMFGFRNPCTLVHNLLSNPTFESGFDYAPYQERTADGVHRFQDFMSGNWAWTRRCVFTTVSGRSVLIVIMLGYHRCRGSSKLMALSFALSSLVVIKLLYQLQQETTSIGLSIYPLEIIHNRVRRAHRNGIVLLGFFAIPKCTCCVILHDVLLTCGFIQQLMKFGTMPTSITFRCQLLHSSLARILESLTPFMKTPEVTRFPDGHFRKVIYGLGPYIADYPEQAVLACIVQGWCPRY
jgi:hypothetical protein